MDSPTKAVAVDHSRYPSRAPSPRGNGRSARLPAQIAAPAHRSRRMPTAALPREGTENRKLPLEQRHRQPQVAAVNVIDDDRENEEEDNDPFAARNPDPPRISEFARSSVRHQLLAVSANPTASSQTPRDAIASVHERKRVQPLGQPTSAPAAALTIAAPSMLRHGRFHLADCLSGEACLRGFYRSLLEFRSPCPHPRRSTFHRSVFRHHGILKLHDCTEIAAKEIAHGF